MSCCEDVAVPYQSARTSGGQFDCHWEWKLQQEVLACDAETSIMPKDLSSSSDPRALGLSRRPRGVGRAGVQVGVIAINPNGGLSESSIRVERLKGQKTPQVPVAQTRRPLVTFWVTFRGDVQTSLRQEVGGRLILSLLGQDHRDTLENPLRARGGGRRHGRKEEQTKQGCRPVNAQEEKSKRLCPINITISSCFVPQESDQMLGFHEKSTFQKPDSYMSNYIHGSRKRTFRFLCTRTLWAVTSLCFKAVNKAV